MDGRAVPGTPKSMATHSSMGPKEIDLDPGAVGGSH